jgi:uncharacterized protein YegL
MKINQKKRQRPDKSRNGAILPFVAVCIIILFVAAALSVDIARIHVTRAELRTATDAAARAAVETLSRTQSTDQAIASAKDLAASNLVAGEPLLLKDSNIVFGRSQPTSDGAFDFVPGLQPFNSARVTGERVTGSPSGPVGLMFGPLFGVTKFEPVQTSTATRLDRDIALVLDVSGSMASFGRFEALQNAITVFLAEIQSSPDDEFVSLSIYNQDAKNLVKITQDMQSIDDEFRRQSPGGFTAIGRGLKVGLKSVKKDPLARGFAEKTVILMTDGNHNTGVNPLVVADDAVKDNITVHTITFSRGANQTLMRQVAEKTGGIHLHADTDSQLIDAFREIALQLPILLTE